MTIEIVPLLCSLSGMVFIISLIVYTQYEVWKRR